MARYQSIIAYDGTDYHGFQRQAGDLATVQAALESALAAIGWRGESLLAAGRTDSGVHAAGQVVAFDLAWKHGPDELTAALNANLPDSIAVRNTVAASADFHPRFDARARHYRYRLMLSQTRDPLRQRYTWRVWPAPDLAAMQKLAQALLGEHDFAAFGQAPIEGGHTVRTLMGCQWSAQGDECWLDVVGDAFLQHMVRRLVSACHAVGSGQVEQSAVLALLDQPAARWQGALAPPTGLCLMQVEYAAIERGERAGGDSRASVTAPTVEES